MNSITFMGVSVSYVLLMVGQKFRFSAKTEHMYTQNELCSAFCDTHNAWLRQRVIRRESKTDSYSKGPTLFGLR